MKLLYHLPLPNWLKSWESPALYRRSRHRNPWNWYYNHVGFGQKYEELILSTKGPPKSPIIDLRLVVDAKVWFVEVGIISSITATRNASCRLIWAMCMSGVSAHNNLTSQSRCDTALNAAVLKCYSTYLLHVEYSLSYALLIIPRQYNISRCLLCNYPTAKNHPFGIPTSVFSRMNLEQRCTSSGVHIIVTSAAYDKTLEYVFITYLELWGYVFEDVELCSATPAWRFSSCNRQAIPMRNAVVSQSRVLCFTLSKTSCCTASHRDAKIEEPLSSWPSRRPKNSI